MVYAEYFINQNTFPAAKFGTFANILNLLIPIAILTGAMLLLIMLLLGAYNWITAGDNPEKLKKARNTLTFAVIGLLIVIISYALVKLISAMFRIQTPL